MKFKILFEIRPDHFVRSEIHNVIEANTLKNARAIASQKVLENSCSRGDTPQVILLPNEAEFIFGTMRFKVEPCQKEDEYYFTPSGNVSIGEWQCKIG